MTRLVSFTAKGVVSKVRIDCHAKGEEHTFLNGLAAEMSIFIRKSVGVFLRAIGHSEVILLEGIRTAAIYERVAIPTFDGKG